MHTLKVDGLVLATGSAPRRVVSNGVEYPANSPLWSYTPDPEPDITPDPEPSPEEQARLLRCALLQNTYLRATTDLLTLAGNPPAADTWPKLEDADYIAVRAAAGAVNADRAARLGETLAYCLHKLTELGVSWDDYTWAPDLAAHTPSIP